MNCSLGTEFINNVPQHIVMLIQVICCLFSAGANLGLLLTSGRQHYFHPNFKILVFALLYVNIFHSFLIGANQALHLYKVMTSFDDCDVLVSNLLCYLFRLPAVICITMFVLIHISMIFERIAALNQRGCYQDLGPKLGYSLALASIVVAVVSSAIRFRNFKFEGYCTFCVAMVDETAPLMLLGCVMTVVFGLLGFVIYATLRWINERRLRKHSFDLNEKYQLKENVLVLRLLGPMFALTYISLNIFVGSLAIVYLKKDSFPSASVHNTVHTAIYIFPYYTLLSPAVIYFTLKRYRKNLQERVDLERRRADSRMQNVYFESYRKQWS